jgi:FkbM family methyltransferase
MKCKMGENLVLKKLKDSFLQDENLTIFDIGACDFSEGLMLKSQFPNADVYGIEADKINFDNHSPKAIQKGIKAFNLAFADFDGKTTFYPSLFETNIQVDWRFAGSILKPILKKNSNEAINHSVTYDDKGVEVETMRIDTFCNKNSINKIDFIHIDVEGAEDKVLSTLGDFRPKFIFAETYHFEIKNYDNKITLDEFDGLLESLGYKMSHRFKYDTLYEKK